jgi:hypothetical protein
MMKFRHVVLAVAASASGLVVSGGVAHAGSLLEELPTVTMAPRLGTAGADGPTSSSSQEDPAARVDHRAQQYLRDVATIPLG